MQDLLETHIGDEELALPWLNIFFVIIKVNVFFTWDGEKRLNYPAIYPTVSKVLSVSL